MEIVANGIATEKNYREMHLRRSKLANIQFYMISRLLIAVTPLKASICAFLFTR